MALWGTKDTVYSTGTVDVDVSTGVLTKNTGSINFTTGGVSVGDVVTVGVNTCEGIVMSVDSTEQLTITKDGLGDTDFSKVAYEIRQKPKYTLHDSNYGVGEIFGVDVDEQEAAREDKSQYRPAHAGWVGITSYTDQHGNTRVKTEVLVAGSSITADDNSDDDILPDS
tara:strand:+ start:153 stop:656 length:504 start_codon:yes stop_codon:yes gene_type:complete